MDIDERVRRYACEVVGDCSLDDYLDRVLRRLDRFDVAVAHAPGSCR